MHPIHLQKVDQEHHRADKPGQRVSPEHHRDLFHQCHCDGDVGDPQEAPAAQHGKHGHTCLSGTAHDGCDAVGEGQKEIKQGHGAGLSHTEADHLWIVVKEGDQVGREDVNTYADDFGHQHGADETKGCSFFGAFILPCTQILSHEGGQCHGKAGHREEGEAFDLGVGTAAGHRGDVEQVDLGLDHHIRDADHRVLQTGGQTKRDDFTEFAGVKANLLQRDTVDGVVTDQPGKTEHCAESLGNNCRQCCGGNAPLKHSDEQQIQNHVGEGRDDQIIQRVAAVAHRLQNTHCDIVHDNGDHAGKVGAEISHRVGHYAFRHADQGQNVRREGDSDDRQQHTGGQTKGDVSVNGFLHIVIPFGTVVSGDGNSGTHGDTVKKANHQKDKTSGGADCGQRILADKIADDQCIYRII